MINTKILWPWNYLLIFPFLSFFFFGFWKLCSISIISNILTHFQSMSHYCTKYLKYLWTLKYCTCMKRSDDVLYITRTSYAFNCVSICEWFLANLHVSGAVVQRCSTKKVFLENPPNLPKNACVFLRFPANSVKSLGIQLLQSTSGSGFSYFLWIWETVHSLVVSDLCSEIKGFRLEPGH